MDEASRVLTEEQLEGLRQKYGKIGVVEYNGHQVVFRKPTRENCREYRRKIASTAEKGDGPEFLAQSSIAAFDGETDPNKARTVYTAVFLEEFPLFANTQKVLSVLSLLSGMAEEEEADELGKGVQFRSGRPKSSSTD